MPCDTRDEDYSEGADSSNLSARLIAGNTQAQRRSRQKLRRFSFISMILTKLQLHIQSRNLPPGMTFSELEPVLLNEVNPKIQDAVNRNLILGDLPHRTGDLIFYNTEDSILEDEPAKKSVFSISSYTMQTSPYPHGGPQICTEYRLDGEITTNRDSEGKLRTETKISLTTPTE